MNEDTLDPTPVSRRIGRFRIPQSMLEEYPDVMMLALSQCIVVRCELSYETMSFEYVAISPHFDEVLDWTRAPEYSVIVDTIMVGGSDKVETRFKGFEKL